MTVAFDFYGILHLRRSPVNSKEWFLIKGSGINLTYTRDIAKKENGSQ